jgi:hypothetical protein
MGNCLTKSSPPRDDSFCYWNLLSCNANCDCTSILKAQASSFDVAVCSSNERIHVEHLQRINR